MWACASSAYRYQQFWSDGLLLASDPWNGYYDIYDTIWVTAHLTQFVENDQQWYFLDTFNRGILEHGGTYIALSNGIDVTIVIQTIEKENSLCHNEMVPPFNWKNETQNITFQLTDPQFYGTALFYFESFLYPKEESYTFVEKAELLVNASGYVTLENVRPNTVITLSTIKGLKGDYPDPPKQVDFPLPCKNSFDTEQNA